jgi:hypothetical protein
MVSNPITNGNAQTLVYGSVLAAAALKTASMLTGRVSTLTNLTAFASGLNGASLVVTAKSLNTLYSVWGKTDKADNETRSSARKALGAALFLATAATLAGTDVAKSKFSALPRFNSQAKPLAYGTLSAAGLISLVQYVNVKNQESKAKAAAALAAAKTAVTADKDAVDAMDKAALTVLIGQIKLVQKSETPKDANTVIGLVNARVGKLNKGTDDAQKFANWKALELAK